jgi:hypothetical protein
MTAEIVAADSATPKLKNRLSSSAFERALRAFAFLTTVLESRKDASGLTGHDA